MTPPGPSPAASDRGQGPASNRGPRSPGSGYLGPQKSRGGAKWVLGGLALLVVIVVTVVTALLITRNSHGPSTGPPPSLTNSPASSGAASADDKGPASIVTEDPTCATWSPIVATLHDALQRGWDRRDSTVPATEWAPKDRELHEAAARSMLSAADETVPLVQLTTHRVMRELYEQSIAYWRAYASSINHYVPEHNYLAAAANGFSSAINWICGAITYGSAAARAPLIAQGVTPLSVSPLGDPNEPRRFLENGTPVCVDWAEMVTQYRASTEKWLTTADPNVPAGQWTPEQSELFTSVVGIISDNANEVQNLGLQSTNLVWRDFADLSAQYRRAYVQSIPSYTPADNYLDSAASELIIAVDQACKALGN